MRNIELKRLNDFFGQELGRTSNGNQPLFKWVETKDLFYLVEHTTETKTPEHKYELIDGYQKVTWDKRIGPGWVVASWQDPGTEAQWKAISKNMLPYPPNGMYFPIEASHIPCEPTFEITQDAVAKIRKQMSQTYEEILAECQAHAEAEEAALVSELQDEIHSDWPVFDGQPMSRPYPKDKEIILQ
jgi:hypothetical protein